MALVTGQVKFQQEPPKFSSALLTVKLSDVSLADAPSQVIAIHTQSIGAEDINTLTFELTPNGNTPEINPKSTYSVSAHISLHPNDNPSEIRQGDYLTTQIYPVLTQGHPTTIGVEVTYIG
jgi:putative lipoprotein